MKRIVNTPLILIFVTVVSTTFAQIPSKDLFLHLAFDNSSIDSTKNSIDTLFGGTFGVDNCGDKNHALQFNGSSDFLRLSGNNSSFPKILNNFSLSFWIKINKTNPTSFESVTSIINQSSSGLVFGVWLYRDLSGKINENAIECSIRSSDNKYYTLHLEHQDLNDGKWHHIAFIVEDLSKSQGTMYFDGSSINEESGHPKQNPKNFNNLDYPLVIGASNNRNKIDRHLEASLDQFLIYSRSLSKAEIHKIIKETCGSVLAHTNDIDQKAIDISISPNPVLKSSKMNLHLSKPVDVIEIFDNHGKLVFQLQEKNLKIIPIEKLNSGIYYIKVWTDKVVLAPISKKILIL